MPFTDAELQRAADTITWHNIARHAYAIDRAKRRQRILLFALFGCVMLCAIGRAATYAIWGF